MLSEVPLDASIQKYIKREKFESCANSDYLTYTGKDSNGSYILALNAKAALRLQDFTCCWSSISRPSVKVPVKKDVDTKTM